MPEPRVASATGRAAGHLLFLGTMIGASALTFLRMTAVALLLPVGDFALYATVIAVGAFLAGPLSFGAIEGTIKAFPRLASEGREASILIEARKIVRLAGIRTAALAVPLLLLGYVADLEWVLLGGLGILVAFGNAVNAVVASMQRAAGSPGTLAAGTLLRSAITFAAVSLAATSGEPITTIAAEIVSMILAAQISVWLFFRRWRRAGEAVPLKPARDRSGFLLFLTYTMIAAPFYLDRLYVTATMGELRAGQYAVLALILLGASLLVNTIAQRAGPDAIRAVHHGETERATRAVGKWIAVNAGVWTLGLGAFATVVVAGWMPESLGRYAIEVDLLWPLLAAGVLLNTGLIEFVVIALDREKSLCAAAALFLALALAAALAIYLARADLLALMWALVLCRLAYALALIGILARALRERGAQPAPG